MSKIIDEILKNYKGSLYQAVNAYGQHRFNVEDASFKETKADLVSLIEEVIGEDELSPEIPVNDYYWRFRNELRAKQRKRLNTLLKAGKDTSK